MERFGMDHKPRPISSLLRETEKNPEPALRYLRDRKAIGKLSRPEFVLGQPGPATYQVVMAIRKRMIASKDPLWCKATGVTEQKTKGSFLRLGLSAVEVGAVLYRFTKAIRRSKIRL